MGTRQSGTLWASAGILLLIAALYSLLCLWTPLAFDDWTFMAEWRDVNGSQGPSLAMLHEFWKDIRQVDNGRLANTFSPLTTMFSPWKEIFPWLTGFFVALIVAFVTRFAFGRRPRPLYLAAAWAGIFFLLPWRNSLFVADYALNYIYSAVVTMFFMGITVLGERRGWTVPRFLLALLLAFFAGGWHEGFAVPTLVGFLLLTLCRSKRGAGIFGGFTPQWYVLGLFYAIITAAFYFCPGMLDRTERELATAGIGASYLKTGVDFLPVIFLLLLVILMLALPRLRRFLAEAWRNIWFVVGIGIVVTGTLLSLLFTHQPRSAFWPDLWAIIMLLVLTRPIWHRLAGSRYNIYVTLVTLAVTLLPMAYILPAQYAYCRESDEILQKMETSKSGTVFHDIIPSASLHPAALKIPSHNVWITAFHYHALKQYTGKQYPAVVPAALKDTSILPGVPLPGNAGAFVAGGVIVIPYAMPEPTTVTVMLTLSGGEEAETPALALPFKAADGNVMTYILPYGFSVDDIKGLSL